MISIMMRIHAVIVTLLVGLLITTDELLASQSQGMAGPVTLPWETPLKAIMHSVQGPVAKAIAVIIIIITGLSLAFGDAGGGFRKLIQIVFGLSIAFAAQSVFLPLFGWTGGALI